MISILLNTYNEREIFKDTPWRIDGVDNTILDIVAEKVDFVIMRDNWYWFQKQTVIQHMRDNKLIGFNQW